MNWPTAGDANREITYAAVGFALSNWEGLEVELCGLYSSYNGWPRGSTESIKGYSAGRIFRERAYGLQTVAASYYRRHCSQAAEGQFCAIMRQAVALSDRRNEIAHGIVHVFNIAPLAVGVMVRTGEQGYTFCLAPPFYDHRKLVFGTDGALDFRPTYAYNSGQIRFLGDQFDTLRVEVSLFARSL